MRCILLLLSDSRPAKALAYYQAALIRGILAEALQQCYQQLSLQCWSLDAKLLVDSLHVMIAWRLEVLFGTTGQPGHETVQTMRGDAGSCLLAAVQQARACCAPHEGTAQSSQWPATCPHGQVPPLPLCCVTLLL